jgi:diguanylate cyclase (GGDEF)-like protein/PAS domain S-box-containing protein
MGLTTASGFPVWETAAAANAVIAACYFGIVWVIVGGLLRTGQLRSNALGLTTSMIFFTCAVHHGSHAVHLVLPLVTSDTQGEAMRQVFGWQMALWDVFGAVVGIVYFSLRSSFGRLLQTPAIFSDMAQARVDAAIAAEHEALNEAQAIGQMGSWRRHVDTGEWDTSVEYRRIFELGEDDDPRESWAQVHPDDVAAVRTALDAAMTGGTGEVGYRYARRDGTQLRLHLRARPDLDADGRVVAISGTVQDLTQQARMEAAVDEAEQRFRTTFEAAPIGVSVVELHSAERGRIVSANPAMSRLLGVPVQQLVGTAVSGLVHPEDHDHLRDSFAELQAGRTDVIELEARLMHRDGHLIWALLTAALLPVDPDGRRLLVTNIMDVSQRKKFEGQLQYLADHDALTGLFNRRRFTEELDRVVKQSERYGDAGAVLFLDLDGFKFVNDSLGHAVGDDLISRVGAMFAATVRDTDVLARVGGDEFAVILTRATEEDAILVAEKLLSVIRRDGVVVSHDRHAQVSTSIGITRFGPGDGMTADELLVEADIAMYDAKEAGKDRYSVYTRSDGRRAQISVRENWNKRLSVAVDQGDFVLHAQPIMSIAGDGPETYELLLRLPDDHGDLIPPGTFLYNAERFGLMTRIDEWVVARAVVLLAESHALDIDLALSVNVSGKTITDPGFGAHVARLMEQHAVRPDRLVIEITETAAITNIQRARTLARELRALGCRIALDDFGAGFASFYYLKHLDFDVLKIDGEFIRNLCSTPSDQLVVRAVVDIARGLRARTVAEFVGDDETLALLADLGVDAGQGYHLGRPDALQLRLPHLRDRDATPRLS